MNINPESKVLNRNKYNRSRNGPYTENVADVTENVAQELFLGSIN